MSIIQGWCEACKENVSAQNNPGGCLVHIFLAIVTFGLWFFVWLILVAFFPRFRPGYRCVKCGGRVEANTEKNISNSLENKCYNCGAELDKNQKFCPECGSILIITCHKCKADNNIKAKYCISCGTKLYKKCPDCKADVSLAKDICPECGYPFLKDEKKAQCLIKCPKCKKKISDSAKKCVHCGINIDEFNQSKKRFNIITFFVICIVAIILWNIVLPDSTPSTTIYNPKTIQYLRIKKDYINVRAEPNGKIIDNRVLYGEIFPYFGYKNGWHKIAVDGRFGYVSDKIPSTVEFVEYTSIKNFLAELSKVEENCKNSIWTNERSWKNDQYDRNEWCDCYTLSVTEMAMRNYKITDESISSWPHIASSTCDERQEERYVPLCENRIKNNSQYSNGYKHDVMGYWMAERTNNKDSVKITIWFQAKNNKGKVIEYEGECVFNNRKEIISSDVHLSPL